MAVKPTDISGGSLDMSLRALLIHMLDKRLDHTVLIMPGTDVRITVTVASKDKTTQITARVEEILR